MSRQGFTIAIVRWPEGGAPLSDIRRRVFVEEQSVPEALEWDGLDGEAVHVLAHDDNGSAIGCGRLLPAGKIGRMAILPEWRRRGVGSAMLGALIGMARQQRLPAVELSAQVDAIPFYEKAGFRAYGSIYMDAGIPHRDMRLVLTV